MRPARIISTLGAAALGMGLCAASAMQPVSLESCARLTHISHGGEAGHRDLSNAEVAWLDWWSQEGVRDTIHLANCETGATLQVVTRSENMGREVPFDRTDRAVAAIERMIASPVTRGFDQIAERLRDLRLSPEQTTLTAEPCACAALYPGARADLPRFELEVL